MKSIFATLGFAGLIVFAVACDSEIDGRPAAEVNEPVVQEQTQGAESDGDDAEVREVEFNGETSSIEWVGAKVTGDHDGGFEDWTGTAVVRDGVLHGLSFEVDTRSIWSDSDRLTGHLKSDDFFDVEKYPEASFESTGIEEYGGEDATHRVTGNFTIRGVTKSVTFPATIEIDDDAVRASTEFTIERTDFGINYKGQPDDLIREQVLLKIALEAP